VSGEPKYYCKNCGSEIKSTDTICPNCGKKLSEVGRRIEVILKENITISDSIKTSLIIDPVPEIEKSLEEQDYFRAATFLVSILEYYGKLIINEKFHGAGWDMDDECVEGFGFEYVCLFLNGMRVIDQPCFSVLIKLNKLRNRLIHIKDAIEFRRMCGHEAEVTIRTALKYIDGFMK